MPDNAQNPGGWDDLALLGVVQGSNKCRTACPTMEVERCRCAAQWSGILAWIAAREAAARREGGEAAQRAAKYLAAETKGWMSKGPLDDMQKARWDGRIHAASQIAAICASLLEDGR